jgi:hypothetical protein
MPHTSSLESVGSYLNLDFYLMFISLCSYADPEVVIGCEDGRAFVYDMYSRSCSSIYR